MGDPELINGRETEYEPRNGYAEIETAQEPQYEYDDEVDVEDEDYVDKALRYIDTVLDRMEKCLEKKRCSKGMQVTKIAEHQLTSWNEDLREELCRRYGVYVGISRGIWVELYAVTYRGITAEFEVTTFAGRILMVSLKAIYV